MAVGVRVASPENVPEIIPAWTGSTRHARVRRATKGPVDEDFIEKSPRFPFDYPEDFSGSQSKRGAKRDLMPKGHEAASVWRPVRVMERA